MRKCSSFMCVLIVLLAGGAEAQRPIAVEAIGFLAMLGGARAWSSCAKFPDIYPSGKELCENMWGGTQPGGQSFKYETDEDKAYTMWWFKGTNPNDVITGNLGHSVPDTCGLNWFHKDVPSPEGPGFTECHPWHALSCCHDATTNTPTKLKEGYGSGYEWDRCGPMSQACERFFVQEACFYECEVNTAPFRRFTDSQVIACTGQPAETIVNATNTLGVVELYTCMAIENSWELYMMPIKASYCDAWHRACAEDYFCGGNTGDYFACATDYHSELARNESNVARELERLANQSARLSRLLEDNKDKDDEVPGWAIAVIVASCSFALLIGAFTSYIIRKEAKGTPLFTSLSAPCTSTTAAHAKTTGGVSVTTISQA